MNKVNKEFLKKSGIKTTCLETAKPILAMSVFIAFLAHEKGMDEEAVCAATNRYKTTVYNKIHDHRDKVRMNTNAVGIQTYANYPYHELYKRLCEENE